MDIKVSPHKLIYNGIEYPINNKNDLIIALNTIKNIANTTENTTENNNDTQNI